MRRNLLTYLYSGAERTADKHESNPYHRYEPAIIRKPKDSVGNLETCFEIRRRRHIRFRCPENLISVQQTRSTGVKVFQQEHAPPE